MTTRCLLLSPRGGDAASGDSIGTTMRRLSSPSEVSSPMKSIETTAPDSNLGHRPLENAQNSSPCAFAGAATSVGSDSVPFELDPVELGAVFSLKDVDHMIARRQEDLHGVLGGIVEIVNVIVGE